MPFGVCRYQYQKQESGDPADSREWLRLVKTAWSGVNKVSETGKLYSKRKVLDSLVSPQTAQVSSRVAVPSTDNSCMVRQEYAVLFTATLQNT